MTQYLISFDQQWVGDHTPEWFASRGPLANAVVEEMKAAGVYVAAGGLDEDLSTAVVADATSGELRFSPGIHGDADHYLGGLTIVEVETAEEARMWAGRLAEACGWPQQLRPMY